MAVAVTDTRLLEGLTNTIQSSKALDLSGNAAAIRDIATQLMAEDLAALKAAVEKEDKEEVQAVEAAHALADHRTTMDEAFSRLYLALHSGILQRRLAGEEGAEVEDLSHYLSQQNPSSFAAASLERAIAGLERSRAFADKYVPDNVRDEVNSFVDSALQKARAAKEKSTGEKAEAVQALGDLEKIREATRDRYLSARDLIGAALREAQQHDKLPQVMPALREVLYPTSGSSSAAADTSNDG